MSKNKLSKKMLKAFSKSVKKVESIAFKKKFKEDGDTYSSFDLLFKHKDGDADKIGDLVKKIWSKKEIPSKSDLKDLVKALVDLKDGKSGSKSKKKKKSSSKKESKVKKTSKNKEAAKETPKKIETKAKKTVPASKPAQPKMATTAPKKVVSTVPKAKTAPAKKATPSKPKAKVVTAKNTVPAKPVSRTTIVQKTAAKKPAIKKVPATKAVVSKSTPKAVATSVKRVGRKPRVGDNLKLIEGIGIKIESFLKEDGIDTFAKLSKAIPAKILAMMIAKGGNRYNANSPDTWPEQAALAAAGKMEELKALKLVLKGGKKV